MQTVTTTQHSSNPLFWRLAPFLAKLGSRYDEPLTLLAMRMKQGMHAGTTAIIMALQAILVTAASPIIFDTRGNRKLWFGLVLEFPGAVLVVRTSGSLGPGSLHATGFALIHRGDATRILAFMYLVPPLVLMLAWLILGETIGAFTLAGLALSVAGVYIVSRQTS